jgi:hypothetical protein
MSHRRTGLHRRRDGQLHARVSLRNRQRTLQVRTSGWRPSHAHDLHFPRQAVGPDCRRRPWQTRNQARRLPSRLRPSLTSLPFGASEPLLSEPPPDQRRDDDLFNEVLQLWADFFRRHYGACGYHKCLAKGRMWLAGHARLTVNLVSVISPMARRRRVESWFPAIDRSQ